MRFFFLDEEPPELTGDWHPPASLGHHLRALRFRAGEEVLLLLPHGGAVRATFHDPKRLELHGLAEPPRLDLLPITLATAWPKGSRGDELVVRATEAGVERILPVVFERSVSGREPFRGSRLQRYRRLARETAQQCRRPTLPIVEGEPVPLRAVLDEAPLAHPILLTPGAWPLQHELDLKTPRELLLLVGPEGGTTPEEEAWLTERGVARAGLLETVLRIEAAGPLAAALCQHDALARRSS